MSILLPLYIYPSAGAWNPLYDAARAHPDVDFSVVVNPCSGPCMGSLPDQVWLDEVPKLANYSNIRRLGYVATNYTSKDIDSVLAEVNMYAKWPLLTNNTEFSVQGIFFDETPSTYEASKYQYLKTAQAYVKNSTRFTKPFIVHNPGLIAPSILNSTSYLKETYMNLTDLTVVFEETFSKFLEVSTFTALQSHKIRKSKVAVLIHSIPTVASNVLDYVVDQMENAADWVFLTDVSATDQYYHSFSSLFTGLVQAVDGEDERRSPKNAGGRGRGKGGHWG